MSSVPEALTPPGFYQPSVSVQATGFILDKIFFSLSLSVSPGLFLCGATGEQ